MMVTSLLLVSGAMIMTWICDKISEAGFGMLSISSVVLYMSTDIFL